MNAPFAQAETGYLLAWAREDHQGQANGPARTLQRDHGVHSAVLGQLFARLSTVTGKNQFEMLEEPAAARVIAWPWPTQAAFETRLRALLPESTMDYLENLGALPTAAVHS